MTATSRMRLRAQKVVCTGVGMSGPPVAKLRSCRFESVCARACVHARTHRSARFTYVWMPCPGWGSFQAFLSVDSQYSVKLLFHRAHSSETLVSSIPSAGPVSVGLWSGL